ncbi:MAG: lysylphosphatidylglycerol synthase transmembrane domain-containing protein [Thermoguttaceae bacterium]
MLCSNFGNASNILNQIGFSETEPNSVNPKLKSYLILLFKIAIVVATLSWVSVELYRSWDSLQQYEWHPNYWWLFVSILFYIVGYLPGMIFWRYSMQSLGQSPGFYESFRAYYIGHLGKYIPGKAVVVVLRSGLLRRDQTRPSVAAAAVFIETLVMMATGGLLSALIVMIWFQDIKHAFWIVLLSLGLMLISGLPILPPLFRKMAKRLGVGRGDPEIDEKLKGLKWKTLGIGVIYSSICWILLGISLWATVRGIGLEAPFWENMARFTLAAALSTVLGFVLMIPGGFGVREVVIAQVLTVYFVHLLRQQGYSNVDAAQLAVIQAILVGGVQRLITILAELGVSLLVLYRPK